MKSTKPLYYRYTESTNSSFIGGKIYKIRNPNDLNSWGNFVDENGDGNGFAPNNERYFTPSTEQEWNKQEGIYNESDYEIY